MEADLTIARPACRCGTACSKRAYALRSPPQLHVLHSCCIRSCTQPSVKYMQRCHSERSQAHSVVQQCASDSGVAGVSDAGSGGAASCSVPAPQQDGEPGGEHSAAADEARYIVRFRQYRMAADHRTTVTAALQSLAAAAPRQSTDSCAAAEPDQQPWRWITRHNKAAAHPTDFGLLAVKPSVADALKVRGATHRIALLARHNVCNMFFIEQAPAFWYTD